MEGQTEIETNDVKTCERYGVIESPAQTDRMGEWKTRANSPVHFEDRRSSRLVKSVHAVKPGVLVLHRHNFVPFRAEKGNRM